MSETKVPVIIDADAFDPSPRNVFRYNGEEHRAFDLLQLPNAVREKVVRLGDHIAACRSVTEQIELAADALRAFVPSASIDELRNWPLEKLLHCLGGLARAGMDDSEERPTTDQ